MLCREVEMPLSYRVSMQQKRHLQANKLQTFNENELMLQGLGVSAFPQKESGSLFMIIAIVT